MEKFIKIFFVFSLTIISIISCKEKEGEEPSFKEAPLITKISRNGVVQNELFYDTKKNLIRLNFYMNGTLHTYQLYEYTAEGIKEMRRYSNATHNIINKMEFSVNNYGCITRTDFYSPTDLQKVLASAHFYYNASGALIRREHKPVNQPMYSVDEYGYNNNGKLITHKRTLHPGQDIEYVYSIAEHTPLENTSIPSKWEKLIQILSVTGGFDDDILNMFYEQKNYKFWNQDKTLSSEEKFEISDMNRNIRGYVDRLVLTKTILPSLVPHSQTEITYEFH